MKTLSLFTLAVGIAIPARAGDAPEIQGDYVEVRTCNVYAGGCFVNGEVGLAGKEAILVWAVRQGSWKNVALDGLSVIAVVSTDETLGDQVFKAQKGKAVLIVDAKADAKQRSALADWARTQAGTLAAEVVSVKTSGITVGLDRSARASTFNIRAAGLVDVNALVGTAKPTPCGSAELWYPPLTKVQDAQVAFTDAAYKGDGLNRRWDFTGTYGGFVAKFAR